MRWQALLRWIYEDPTRLTGAYGPRLFGMFVVRPAPSVEARVINGLMASRVEFADLVDPMREAQQCRLALMELTGAAARMARGLIPVFQAAMVLLNDELWCREAIRAIQAREVRLQLGAEEAS